uniref:Uncharacterized protein n=2 Tax=Plectus sambesii TaxID=2011161 RepID=A0A914VK18_9BILA
MVSERRLFRSRSVDYLVPQREGSFSRPGTLLVRDHSVTSVPGAKLYRAVGTSPALYMRYGYRRDWDIRADYYNNRHYDYEPHSVNPAYGGSWYGYYGFPGHTRRYIDNYYDRYTP